MNQANQKQLCQATNQGLLSIRQSEINYYQSLNVAFGTQAALIGGFTYGVFTQNQINDQNGYSGIDALADCYWVCSAVTIALSVHVILCTTLMQVLGPGLSLNGPVGSMARATEGMRIEQKPIIRSFIAMMIMFAVSTVLSCWVVMSFQASVGCSIAFFIAACYWYKYCERIYLRFYWDQDHFGWQSRGNSTESFDAADPAEDEQAETAKQLDKTLRAINRRNKHGNRRGIFGFFRKRETESISSPRDGQRQKSTASDFAEEVSSGGDNITHTVKGGEEDFPEVAPARRPPSRSTSDNKTVTRLAKLMLGRERALSEVSEDPGISPNLPGNWAIASARRGIVLEGYLTKRGGSAVHYLDFGNEPWERRYFTLTNACNLFVYKNRFEFRNDPKNPVYLRPLHLMDYYLEVHSATGDSVSDHRLLLETDDDNETMPYRFQMTLVLRENVHAVKNMAILGFESTGEIFNALNAPGSTVGKGSVLHISDRSSLPANSKKSSATTAPDGEATTASSARQQMYRDHWVLRCDTEEELHRWVSVITALCPSCFVIF